MQDYPFVSAVVACETPFSAPFAKLSFKAATLSLYLNGGEIYASVEGELSTWDLRNLEAMSRGLYPLYAGLKLEQLLTNARSDKRADLKLSELVEHLPLPVHHSRS